MQRVPRNLIWTTRTNLGVREGFSEEVTSEFSRRRKSLSGRQPGKRVFHARREAFVEAQGNKSMEYSQSGENWVWFKSAECMERSGKPMMSLER